MKTVLELTATEASDYFLSSSNYSTISFPKYINFDQILKFVKKKIGKRDFEGCLKFPEDIHKKYPSAHDNVSYQLLMNKDGRYAYRPLQLVNPFLYYFLVREITKTDNWKFLQNRFKELTNEKCEVSSIPFVKDSQDKNVTATTIKSWWEHIEQRSIELSLEYKYIFITDITNCYGSIYTHTVSWALYGMDYAKENKQEKNLGKAIDDYIMGMQYGQTNGIPQGSILFDFVAEIVLSYVDYLLLEDLKKSNISEYKILRYRDDYRIFSNSKEDMEIIAMKLQAVLSKLNLQINSSKTVLSEDVVESSIKKDKLFFLINTPIYKGNESVFNTLQQELLFILQFSRLYPNSGTLNKLLNKFLKILEMKEFSHDEIKENAHALSAIVVEIAMNSPKTHNLIVSILSRFLSELNSPKDQAQLIKNIYKKFSRLPNTGYLDIWMQRLTYFMENQPDYKEPICKIVRGDELVSLWNNKWLKDELIKDFPSYSIYVSSLKEDVSPVIRLDEVSVFDGY